MFFRKKKECPVCKTPLDKAKAELMRLTYVHDVKINLDEYSFKITPRSVEFCTAEDLTRKRYSSWERYRHLTEGHFEAMCFFANNYEEIRKRVKIAGDRDRRNLKIEAERKANEEAYRKKKVEECEIKLLEMIEDADG